MFPIARVIGLPVTVASIDAVAERIVQRASTRTAASVCVANVDMFTRARVDRGLRAIIEDALYVVADGMPLVWMLRVRGHAKAQRVYGPDLMHALCRHAAEQGVSIYLYGGSAIESASLQRILKNEFPLLKIAGSETPPLLPARPEVDLATVARIEAAGAGLVFVGLGCPKQEYWMRAYAPHLRAVTVGVGLAFAQIAGLVPRAPRWMQRSGLEWMFRLAHEPRRLWRRYLVGNARFIGFATIDLAISLREFIFKRSAKQG